LIGYRDEITGDMPRRSRFGREFSDFWIRLEAGGNARDTQSGFRAYPLPAVLQMQLDSHFYNFEMEIITKAMWAGLRVGNVPIRVWYPPVAERVSSFDPLRDNLRISLLHTRLLLRQILPVPHRRIETPGAPAGRPLRGWDINPFVVAISAGLSIIMGIVLWPWGILPVAYVSMRLHLSSVVAFICVMACTPAFWPAVCLRAGGIFVPGADHPHLRWIVGSHLVALPLSVMTGCFVYAVVAHFEKQSRAVPARSGATRPGSVEAKDTV
jgi:hypothetical protein